MFSLLRSGYSGSRLFGRRSKLFAVAAAVSAGGCSADIARFDFPSANLTNTSTGTIPVPSEFVSGPYALGAETPSEAPVGAPSSYAAPSSSESQRVDVAALDPPAPLPAPPARTYQAPPPTQSYAPAPVAEEEKGAEIEVQRGDTLYGLSRRHGVSLNELMRVNGLTNPTLMPGQKLALPSGKVAPRAPQPSRTVAAEPVPAPADWTGTYTIQSGDSLYAIARRNDVKVADLQRYNSITDPRRVRPGTVLKIPGVAGAAMAEASPSVSVAPPPLAPPSSAPVTAVVPPLGAAPAAPTILNAPRSSEEKQVAALEIESKTDAASVSAPASGSVAEGGKLRWPAKGRIIAGYGPRSDGTHNDGINISVPQGTDVHAAENGTVAYAGNELKGYGNLILVRHDNGWVTAYAHADELLVKRGDRVSRGQVIAKAGRTGQVDRPQLHFEVRLGQKPVDPTLYLEKL